MGATGRTHTHATHPSSQSHCGCGLVCCCSGSSAAAAASVDRDALESYARQRLAELRRLNSSERINVIWYDSAWVIRFRQGSGHRSSRTINPQKRTPEGIDKALEKAVETRNRLAKTIGNPPIRSLWPDQDHPAGAEKAEEGVGDGQGDYEVVIEGSDGEPEDGGDDEDEDEEEGEHDNQGHGGREGRREVVWMCFGNLMCVTSPIAGCRWGFVHFTCCS